MFSHVTLSIPCTSHNRLQYARGPFLLSAFFLAAESTNSLRRRQICPSETNSDRVIFVTHTSIWEQTVQPTMVIVSGNTNPELDQVLAFAPDVVICKNSRLPRFCR